MQPGEDRFQFIMEVDRLAPDLYRLGDRPVSELRKCVIIVTVLPAGYEIGVRVLENNPAGLERTEIERVVGNQYIKLFRHQHDSESLSVSGSITTVESRREEEETTQPVRG